MDELTLGLIGAGAVVVGGVVVYNAWQGAKVRRKMPRPMPDEAAESLARNDVLTAMRTGRTASDARTARPSGRTCAEPSVTDRSPGVQCSVLALPNQGPWTVIAR